MNERMMLVLGFGLFMMSYGGGPFGFISGTTQQGTSWQAVLLIETSFFAGVVIGCALLRLLMRRDEAAPSDTLGSVGLVAVNLFGLIMQPILNEMAGDGAIAARTLFSAIAGVVYVIPFLFWIDRLFSYGKRSSHLSIISILLLCYLLLPLVMLPFSFISVPYGYSFAQLGCAILSATIQMLYMRGERDRGAETCLSNATAKGKPLISKRPSVVAHGYSEAVGDRYRLTTYSFLLLTSLGFAWGMSNGSSVYNLAGDFTSAAGLSFAGALACTLILALLVWAVRGRHDMKFGFVIRLAIVVCGATQASIPLLIASEKLV